MQRKLDYSNVSNCSIAIVVEDPGLAPQLSSHLHYQALSVQAYEAAAVNSSFSEELARDDFITYVLRNGIRLEDVERFIRNFFN